MKTVLIGAFTFLCFLVSHSQENIPQQAEKLPTKFLGKIERRIGDLGRGQADAFIDHFQPGIAGAAPPSSTSWPKRARSRGVTTAFVDPDNYRKFVAEKEQAFRDELRKQQSKQN